MKTKPTEELIRSIHAPLSCHKDRFYMDPELGPCHTDDVRLLALPGDPGVRPSEAVTYAWPVEGTPRQLEFRSLNLRGFIPPEGSQPHRVLLEDFETVATQVQTLVYYSKYSEKRRLGKKMRPILHGQLRLSPEGVTLAVLSDLGDLSAVVPARVLACPGPLTLKINLRLLGEYLETVDSVVSLEVRNSYAPSVWRSTGSIYMLMPIIR